MVDRNVVLPARGQERGVEASGFGGRLAVPEFKFTEGYMAEEDGH